MCTCYVNANLYYQDLSLFFFFNTSQKTSRYNMEATQNCVLTSTDTALELRHIIKKNRSK